METYSQMSLLDDHADKISAKYDADVFVFSATISYKNVDDLLYQIVNLEARKENCILILTTNGGDPDAGYRLVRFVKRKYTKFYLFVCGICKSAGTLIALGANEIRMGDFGELGPLDIQLTKDDELANTSGLSYFQSLVSLHERMFSSFEENLLNLKRMPIFGASITIKTASEIATKLATGLIQPISEQIDPLKLGEVQRSIKISEAYGLRILPEHGPKILKKLIAEYPSHSFVIDFQETKELFKGTKIEVKELEIDEVRLENILWKVIREEKEDLIWHISSPLKKDKSLQMNNLQSICLQSKPLCKGPTGNNKDEIKQIISDKNKSTEEDSNIVKYVYHKQSEGTSEIFRIMRNAIASNIIDEKGNIVK